MVAPPAVILWHLLSCFAMSGWLLRPGSETLTKRRSPSQCRTSCAVSFYAVNIALTCKTESPYTSLTFRQYLIKKYLYNLKSGGTNMAEEKGLNKPVKLKADLAAFLGASALPRTEITKKLWDYIKANKLQTTTVNGKPENAGKNIVADAKLVKIFNNTRVTGKSGKVTDLTKLKEGETIDMMQMAAVVSANIE
jgi:chromatin remodeling complex protein RSC6